MKVVCLCKSCLCLAIALGLSPGGAAWSDGDRLAPFEARYDLFRNGKHIGETRIRFAMQDDHWTLNSDTRGTHGLARFLGAEEHSSSKGDWQAGQPRPLNFREEIKVAMVKHHVSADFDWDAGTIHSTWKDGTATVATQPGAIDAGSVGLLLRTGLAEGRDEWQLPVLDEDELDEQTYRAAPPEQIDTALGCLAVRKVERIRPPGNLRYTRTYQAADLAWVPVLVVHGKQGGDHLESHIASLTLDGEAVAAGPPCAEEES